MWVFLQTTIKTRGVKLNTKLTSVLALAGVLCVASPAVMADNVVHPTSASFEPTAETVAQHEPIHWFHGVAIGSDIHNFTIDLADFKKEGFSDFSIWSSCFDINLSNAKTFDAEKESWTELASQETAGVKVFAFDEAAPPKVSFDLTSPFGQICNVGIFSTKTIKDDDADEDEGDADEDEEKDDADEDVTEFTTVTGIVKEECQETNTGCSYTLELTQDIPEAVGEASSLPLTVEAVSGFNLFIGSEYQMSGWVKGEDFTLFSFSLLNLFPETDEDADEDEEADEEE